MESGDIYARPISGARTSKKNSDIPAVNPPSERPPAALLDGAALFLDFDGTLVDLADTPDAVSVSAGLPSLLRRLCSRLGGRVAIVSGRAVRDLERHLDCSGIAISGSHGLELRLATGEHLPLAAPVGIAELRDEIARFAEAAPGLLIEEKPASIALHYRQAPHTEEEVNAFMASLAQRSGFVLQAGKMVLELRPSGADKGDALRTFMAQPPFAGSRPIFIGDDVTDEHGFEAAAAMGGAGVLVGPPRPSAARFRLDGVAEVAEWLEAAAR